jgi:hypothetical protein
VTSQRGPEGGFKLARDPDTMTIADIVRVVSGPMAGVRGMRPETLIYEGEARHLRDVWIAVRGALREVLEHVTLGQVLRGELPGGDDGSRPNPDVGHPSHMTRRFIPTAPAAVTPDRAAGRGPVARRLRQRRRGAHDEPAHGGHGGHRGAAREHSKARSRS